MNTVMAWYFCGSDRKLRYGDGRAVVDGETLTVDCEPILCRQGLHASVSLLDALSYAPGLVLCRVEVSGDVVIGHDKIVGRNRTVKWSLGETEMRDIVVRFAQWCASRAKEHAADAHAAAAWYATVAAAYAAHADDAHAATYASNAATAASKAAVHAADATHAAAARSAEYKLQSDWLINAVSQLTDKEI